MAEAGGGGGRAGIIVEGLFGRNLPTFLGQENFILTRLTNSRDGTS